MTLCGMLSLFAKTGRDEAFQLFEAFETSFSTNYTELQQQGVGQGNYK